jgi:predicted membrane protein
VKGFILLIVLLAALMAGGALTAQLTANEGVSILPILEVTSSPDASRTVMLPWKAEQFFLLVGAIIFNLIGIAATIALVIWFLDRGVKRSQASASGETGAQMTRTE